MRTHGTFVKFTTVEVSLSKDVFDKAVKSALGKVNTHGINNLTQHQSKALFLCGKDSFVCLPTGHGKSLIYQLEQKNLGCSCFRTKKFYFWFERESIEGLHECALQRLFLWRNDIYFGQRRDKQTARETIICRLAAGKRNGLSTKYNLPHGREVWIRNKLDTNGFCWMKGENVEDERDSTRKYFWMTGTKRGKK